MRNLLFLITSLLVTSVAMAQPPVPKTVQAIRTSAAIKVDGNLDEAAWKGVVPATDFIEWRPNAGKAQDAATKTVVYLLYDNTSVYVGGYCYEKTKDSISSELVGRDVVGVNDFIGVIFDTYNDKINASGFYVTPYGEQFDAKYSNSNGEDGSWNAVWDSEAKIHPNGWSFEMRIPYSALRFSSTANQKWGLNITRRRTKSGKQYMWNPVDPKVNGFTNQEGEWTGIEKIDAPLRLSFSPYFSTYLNHYPYKTAGVKDYQSSVNGGMDVKYGISDAFTLDMTLVPDFGQVQSDNKVLNLSPFEVQYNENRGFFTEGTELFNKGNLFYSRRIGGTPLHYYDVEGNLPANQTLTSNPSESKLINATKISGRTKHGLGVGFFNAVTKAMYATAEDPSGAKTVYQTAPLTNYSIAVLDQTLKNNSSISFINTNVLRNGRDYDANVSAALFDFNNKTNTYNWSGKVSVSHLGASPLSKASTGYAHYLSFGKTGGRFTFSGNEDLANSRYDINDMGILFTNNYINHYLGANYRWLKPTTWYNNIQINYNANHSLLFAPVAGQKIQSHFQGFNMNINGNIQFKNLWSAFMYLGFVTRGNDFYEPRVEGWSFQSPRRLQFSPSFQSNEAKKYTIGFSYFLGLRSLFNSPLHQLNLSQRYRFSDKFSLTHEANYNPTTNDAGFYGLYRPGGVLKNILFSRRDRKTIENVLSAKYNFNNKSGITFRARHYQSKVVNRQLYDLQPDGSLQAANHPDVTILNRNTNFFNIDAVYTLQFAPGSFINVVWKNAAEAYGDDTGTSYFKNFSNTLAVPQNNNVSLRILYYLDYLTIKKWKAKKVI